MNVGENPSVIPNSPQGGNAFICRDTPGGNTSALSTMAKEDITLETYIYIAPDLLSAGYEESRIGIRGGTDGWATFDYYHGSTGLAWFIQRGSTWHGAWLIDEDVCSLGTNSSSRTLST